MDRNGEDERAVAVKVEPDIAIEGQKPKRKRTRKHSSKHNNETDAAATENKDESAMKLEPNVDSNGTAATVSSSSSSSMALTPDFHLPVVKSEPRDRGNPYVGNTNSSSSIGVDGQSEEPSSSPVSPPSKPKRKRKRKHRESSDATVEENGEEMKGVGRDAMDDDGIGRVKEEMNAEDASFGEAVRAHNILPPSPAEEARQGKRRGQRANKDGATSVTPAGEEGKDASIASQSSSLAAASANSSSNLKGKGAKSKPSASTLSAAPAPIQRSDEHPNVPDGCFRIFIGGLPYTTTKEEVRDFLSVCGNIWDVRLATYPQNGEGRGFGHVEFEKESDVERALKLNQTWFRKKKITIRLATEKPENPKKPDVPVKKEKPVRSGDRGFGRGGQSFSRGGRGGGFSQRGGRGGFRGGYQSNYRNGY